MLRGWAPSTDKAQPRGPGPRCITSSSRTGWHRNHGSTWRVRAGRHPGGPPTPAKKGGSAGPEPRPDVQMPAWVLSLLCAAVCRRWSALGLMFLQVRFPGANLENRCFLTSHGPSTPPCLSPDPGRGGLLLSHVLREWGHFHRPPQYFVLLLSFLRNHVG